MESIVLQYLNR